MAEFYIFSLAYLSEHMDPLNSLPPLLGVQLTLNEKEMMLNCEPPLDSSVEGCFSNIVNELLSDIVGMASLIPRVSLHKGQHYMVCLIFAELSETVESISQTFRAGDVSLS